MTTVYLNGKYVPKEQAMIPVEDRGFIFGDGIYEVVRVIKGAVFAWDAHAARLANGLDGLRINRAGTEGLKAVCEKLVADNALAGGEATVYLQVSRGAAPRTRRAGAAAGSSGLTIRRARAAASLHAAPQRA